MEGLVLVNQDRPAIDRTVLMILQPRTMPKPLTRTTLLADVLEVLDPRVATRSPAMRKVFPALETAAPAVVLPLRIS